ncbi:MAG: hypothetical protein RI897_3884 [Verrucomicrobiota bacterium]
MFDHVLELFAVEKSGGFGEPLDGQGFASELAGVAGEVVGDGSDEGELLAGGEEGVPGVLRTFHFVQAKGLIDPAGGIFGVELQQGDGEFERVFPVCEVGADVPAHLEGGGVGAEVVGEGVEFGGGFLGVAEFQPALGGQNGEAVLGFELGHGANGCLGWV